MVTAYFPGAWKEPHFLPCTKTVARPELECETTAMPWLSVKLSSVEPPKSNAMETRVRRAGDPSRCCTMMVDAGMFILPFMLIEQTLLYRFYRIFSVFLCVGYRVALMVGLRASLGQVFFLRAGSALHVFCLRQNTSALRPRKNTCPKLPSGLGLGLATAAAHKR